MQLFKWIHNKYKELEPYNTILGILGIGGGSVMSIWAGFKALSSPIVGVLGNSLSFIVGATLAILLTISLARALIFFREFFLKNKKVNTNKFHSSLTDKEVEFLLDGFWKGNCFIYKNPSPRGILKHKETNVFFKEPSYPALVGHFENLKLNKDNNYFFQQTLLARAPNNSKCWIRFLLEEAENVEITIYDADKQEKICLPNHSVEVMLDKDSNFHFMIRGKKELSLLGVKIEIMKWEKL